MLQDTCIQMLGRNWHYFLVGLASSIGLISLWFKPLTPNSLDALSDRVPPHFNPRRWRSCFKWSSPNSSNSWVSLISSKLIGEKTRGSVDEMVAFDGISGWVDSGVVDTVGVSSEIGSSAFKTSFFIPVSSFVSVLRSFAATCVSSVVVESEDTLFSVSVESELLSSSESDSLSETPILI